MSRGYPVKTPGRVAEAQRLRGEGKTLAQIGERFGVRTQTVSSWLTDPDGTLQAVRRARSTAACAGQCDVCGAPTDGSRGRVNAAGLCPTHAAEEAKVWTREAIILAIQEWAAKYGEPPASPDWNAWACRHEMHDEERAQRFEREYAAGTCPWFSAVVREFDGSWNAALVAAGFTSRPAHGGGGNAGRRRDQRAKRAA